MRKAKYSAKKVYLPNSSRVGYDVSHAKPGHWIVYQCSGVRFTGRVLGRVDRTCSDGMEDCAGWIAALVLSEDMSSAFVRWVAPEWVLRCLKAPPRELLAWITGDEWPKRAADIPRMLAMQDHGTCCESYIASRNDPAKPFNKNPEYIAQFVLS
jgi:hypothetical protein